MLSVYYFMTAGGVKPDTGDVAKYVWYLHAMLISFSFIVSIILLNLLISIMSGTYAEVKKSAEKEWRLLIARDVVEIDSSGSFGGPFGRLGPKWIPLSKDWMKENGHKLRKDQLHKARDAHINNIKAQVDETKEQVSDIKQQILSLQQDMRDLTSMLLANRNGGGGLPPGDEPTTAGGR
ncbi:hypothetical protein Vretifemale_19474 [Volvox reticuliferus]|uniref:Ion transport domain-containing protein n=1 Tax=Volvox reticuliferus TaxID=1737510 RepID=A0A8J4CZH2_9CHLO|nr:hypothetical protein Vretifemale_19474 [Volvox reticuliferus]